MPASDRALAAGKKDSIDEHAMVSDATMMLRRAGLVDGLYSQFHLDRVFPAPDMNRRLIFPVPLLAPRRGPFFATLLAQQPK